MNATKATHDTDADPELIAALEEYLDHFDSPRRAALYARLQRNPGFHDRMTDAISDMAMLVAAAHVIDDENEFETVAGRAFEECLLDPEEIRELRLYYLDNLDSVAFPAELANLSGQAVKARLAKQKAHYLILHDYQ
jgi:hypothetical protein